MDLVMRPIACFNAFFDLLLAIGLSEDVSARLAAGHGLLAPVLPGERIEVARA